MEEILEKLLIDTVQDAISDNDYTYNDSRICIKRGNLELIYDVDTEMVDTIVRKLEELE